MEVIFSMTLPNFLQTKVLPSASVEAAVCITSWHLFAKSEVSKANQSCMTISLSRWPHPVLVFLFTNATGTDVFLGASSRTYVHIVCFEDSLIGFNIPNFPGTWKDLANTAFCLVFLFHPHNTFEFAWLSNSLPCHWTELSNQSLDSSSLTIVPFFKTRYDKTTV